MYCVGRPGRTENNSKKQKHLTSWAAVWYLPPHPLSRGNTSSIQTRLLPHRIHQSSAGECIRTWLICLVHSKNIHLLKMCEAEIKRNSTPGIKRSLHHTLEGDGGDTGVSEGGREERRREGCIKSEGEERARTRR